MSSTTTSAASRVPEPPSWTAPPATVEEGVTRARDLRPWIARRGAEYDATGADPADVMDVLAASGIQAINVPVEFGGLLTTGPFARVVPVVDVWCEITAGDGSIGQLWGSSAFLTRTLLQEGGLPEETRIELAREILRDGRRLALLQSERGTTGPTLARRVPGGLVVNGTKSFGTNTARGGRDLANVVLGLVDEDDPTVITPHAALVRLDTPGVEPLGGWDNMGQRATNSQTIHFRDVFVPDGWHYAAGRPHPAYFGVAMLANATMMQGIGAGALEAALDHLRGMDRASMPMFESAATDPAMHRRIGELAAGLAAAREFILATARRLDADPESIDYADFLATALQADIVATRAALTVTSDMFELTGARSTSAAHRLDRFWRNARTFASHHPRDSTSAYVGFVRLNRTHPPVTDYLKL
ncbi:acyl-CoA dehydrogenase family protein [Streptomyces tendae]|uniref:acyl-CoA dehydrogenase family protein n=1 Tax=Streptomyces tendae TaxID=1932 RepID=UPI0037A73BEC